MLGGYGLVDSAKVTPQPGQHLNITAMPAPTPAAAQYYPPIYWYSMLRIPSASEFGKHPGIAPNMTQTRWLEGMKRNGCVEPNEPIDPTKDHRINAGFYAVMPSPVDGSVWGSFRGATSGVVRIAPGANPPQTAISEVYNVPLPGFGVRGADINSKGVEGFDGRIDDPKAGWKGRGLWAANGDRTPWLIEGGKGTKPLAAHF